MGLAKGIVDVDQVSEKFEDAYLKNDADMILSILKEYGFLLSFEELAGGFVCVAEDTGSELFKSYSNYLIENKFAEPVIFELFNDRDDLEILQYNISIELLEFLINNMGYLKLPGKDFFLECAFDNCDEDAIRRLIGLGADMEVFGARVLAGAVMDNNPCAVDLFYKYEGEVSADDEAAIISAAVDQARVGLLIKLLECGFNPFNFTKENMEKLREVYFILLEHVDIEPIDKFYSALFDEIEEIHETGLPEFAYLDIECTEELLPKEYIFKINKLKLRS